MAEKLKFKDIFFNNIQSHVELNTRKYLLGIYAIELIKNIEPTRINSDVGYMYALEHGDLLSQAASKGWESYTAKNNKAISAEIILQSLEMVELLIEPFTKPTVDTDSVFTVRLPMEITRVLAHEDLTDPNVMNTLELSVRHLHLKENMECPRSSTSFENRAFGRLTMTQVCKLFTPLFNKCKFKNLSEERLLKDYNRNVLHHMGIWLSCLYRLFYTFDRDYWDTFDDFVSRGYICPMAISKALDVPVVEPETVIGIVSDRRFNTPPLSKNRSSYLSLAERYLSLLYNHTV